MKNNNENNHAQRETPLAPNGQLGAVKKMYTLIILFSGFYESGKSTEKMYEIVNIEGILTMDKLMKELMKTIKLSPFRDNKRIKIHNIQPV